MLNQHIPVNLGRAPMARLMYRESPQIFFSKKKVSTQGETSLIQALNLHSFSKSDISSVNGKAYGSQYCKHELD